MYTLPPCLFTDNKKNKADGISLIEVPGRHSFPAAPLPCWLWSRGKNAGGMGSNPFLSIVLSKVYQVHRGVWGIGQCTSAYSSKQWREGASLEAVTRAVNLFSAADIDMVMMRIVFLLPPTPATLLMPGYWVSLRNLLDTNQRAEERFWR